MCLIRPESSAMNESSGCEPAKLLLRKVTVCQCSRMESSRRSRCTRTYWHSEVTRKMPSYAMRSGVRGTVAISADAKIWRA